MVLLNAKVITMDHNGTTAEAVAIKKERIVAVGSNEKITQFIGEATKILHLNGKVVLPGFIDTHMHLTFTGLALASLDLYEMKSLKEILEKLRARAKTIPEGKLILGFRLDETKYVEKRFPTRFELDEVAPDHYVALLHVTGHACVVNTKTLRHVNLPFNEPGVDKDGNTGEPTGTIRDPILMPVLNRIFEMISDDDFRRAMKIAAEEAVKVGLTTIHTMGEPAGERTNKILKEIADELPVKIIFYPFITSDIDKGIKNAPKKGGLKVFADGAFENHTAALFEQYTDDPSTKGMLYFTQEEMNEIVLKVHKAGLQLAIHCESEASIEQVLNAYENALREYPRADHRHRIEHYELPAEDQNMRVAKLGVSLSMQPAFIYFWGRPGEKYEQLLGERVKKMHPYKTLLELGILVSGGSDSMVTPMNPLLGIHSLVNNPNVTQRVSIYEALKIFTINGAKIAFEEKEKGTIEPGKFADLVVLSEDPTLVKPDKIKDIDVLMTIINGRIVYQKPSVRNPFNT